MTRFNKSKGPEKPKNQSRDFVAGIHALQAAGWTPKDIEQFLEEAQSKRQTEEDDQRTYEAGLTPEQRAAYRDYFSKAVHGTLITYDKKKEQEIHLRQEAEKIAQTCIERYHELADKKDLTNKKKRGLQDDEYIVVDNRHGLLKRKQPDEKNNIDGNIYNDDAVAYYGTRLFDENGKFDLFADTAGKKMLLAFIDKCKKLHSLTGKSSYDIFSLLDAAFRQAGYTVSSPAHSYFFEKYLRDDIYFTIFSQQDKKNKA